MNSLIVLLLIATVSQVLAITPAGLADKIISLPGLASTPSFDQYSGYLDIPDEKYPGNTRHIFYWYVASSSASSATDPLVFWSNGGPGCSGLIGLFEEFGPFHPNSDGKTLYENPYSWNSVANLVFIEAPAGVGFSYADNETDYTVGDERTARDNLQAVFSFLFKFDDFVTNNNDIYVASESYGGHYGPQWAVEILASNKAGLNQNINFKGFFVGNPYTNPNENIIGAVGTFAGHALIPSQLWKQIQDNCFPTQSGECNDWINSAYGLVGDLDPYSLDTPVCLASGGAQAQRRRLLTVLGRLNNKSKKITQDPTVPPYDPCIENYETAYLNLASVQSALHARLVPTSSWASCSNVIDYSYADSDLHIETLYPQILNDSPETNKYVVFSGDDDSVCGALGTESWIFDSSLGLTISSNWTVWTYEDQVAGYLTKFSGGRLSFATVHAAGHEVAMIQPQRALALFTSYLNGDLN